MNKIKRIRLIREAKEQLAKLEVVTTGREPKDDELAVVSWKTIRLCREALEAVS